MPSSRRLLRSHGRGTPRHEIYAPTCLRPTFREKAHASNWPSAATYVHGWGGPCSPAFTRPGAMHQRHMVVAILSG
jgi:hypothetical protein